MGLKSVVVGGAITFALMSYGGAMVPEFEASFDDLFKPDEMQAVEVDLLGEELKRSEIDTQIKGLTYELAERETQLKTLDLETQITAKEQELALSRALSEAMISQEVEMAIGTAWAWWAIETGLTLFFLLVFPVMMFLYILAKIITRLGDLSVARATKEVYDDGYAN